MSDDSFIREVEQELRSDRFNALWKRFAPVIIGSAVLVVALTAAWRGWQYYQAGQANASGDRFLQAVELAEAGNADAALTELRALEADGAGRYDLLARLRAAALLAETDPAGAVASYRAVAEDGDTPEAIANIARLRAAYLLVDHGAPADVEALAATLANPNDPMRHSAREAMGLAALRAGDLPGAAARFEAILDDQSAPQGVTARAGEMLAFLRSRGVQRAEPPVGTPAEPATGGSSVEPAIGEAAAPDASSDNSPAAGDG